MGLSSPGKKTKVKVPGPGGATETLGWALSHLIRRETAPLKLRSPGTPLGLGFTRSGAETPVRGPSCKELLDPRVQRTAGPRLEWLPHPEEGHDGTLPAQGNWPTA